MYELYVAFRDSPVMLRFSSLEIHADAASLFRHFERPVSTVACPSFSVSTDGEHAIIACPNGEQQRTSSRSVTAILKKKVTAHWIDSHPGYLWLHAGAVARDGWGIMFTGPTGSGKSTLAMACAQAGWQYLCDDVLAVEPGSLSIHPLPFPPERRTRYLESMSRSDFLFQDKTRRAVDPPPPAREPVRANGLFVVQFVNELKGNIDCEALTLVQAASEVLAQSFGPREQHGAIIARTMKLINRMAPVRRLRFTDTEPVLDYLEQQCTARSERTAPAFDSS